MDSNTHPPCYHCGSKSSNIHSVLKNWGDDNGVEERYFCCKCYTDYVNESIDDICENYELSRNK